MTTIDLLRPYEAQMIADRRWLHEHPELSGQETQTLDYITRALEEMGLSIHIVPNGGVIGVLNEKAQGPCVLLRADVDALPVLESTENLSGTRRCISQNPGAMHACGHDAHAAMLLGAARALSADRENVPGCVLFVFERGEEKGGRGFLENLLPYIDEHFNVGACYGTHVRWDIPAGKIAVPDGIAIVKDCKNLELAQLFVEYALSADTQAAQNKDFGRRPIRSDVTPVGLNPLGDITLMNYNFDYAGANKADIVEKWQDAVVGD